MKPKKSDGDETKILSSPPSYALRDDELKLLAKELDLPPESKFRHDEAVELKAEMNRMWQVIHQKGLDVGLPRIILFDINAIMISVNKMNAVWAGDDVRKKEREEDEDITKLLNRGDEMLAFHRVREQVLQMREQRVRMSTFLSILIDKFEMLSNRLHGKDMEAMEK